MTKRFRILFAPLDWGLGHSSRCIPIIKSFLSKGVDVIIGGSGSSFELLKKEFPQLESVPLENFPITYPRSGNFTWHFILKFPKLLSFIKKEHQLLSEIIVHHHIDAVVSDNRYGLYNKNIPSIFISHQIVPRSGLFQSITKRFIKNLIEKFDQLWIPDINEVLNLAGEMSRSSHISIPVLYLGPLSRMNPIPVQKTNRILAILSGPEPQRTSFEQQLIEKLKEIEGDHAIVRGVDETSMIQSESRNVQFYNLLPTEELQSLIESSEFIICRSGYSSIMDLMKLNRTALLVPTKNQPEQEYLAKIHSNQGLFICQDQDKLDIKKALAHLEKMENKVLISYADTLNEVVSDFCQSLY